MSLVYGPDPSRRPDRVRYLRRYRCTLREWRRGPRFDVLYDDELRHSSLGPASVLVKDKVQKTFSRKWTTESGFAYLSDTRFVPLETLKTKKWKNSMVFRRGDFYVREWFDANGVYYSQTRYTGKKVVR